MVKKLLLKILPLLHILLSCILPSIKLVTAATTRLYVEPASIVDETLTPGSNIVVTVKIADVTNMYAYEFKIFYKNSVLNVTKVVRPPGHFMEPSDPTFQFIPKWEIKNNFNATHGRLWLGFTLLSPEPPKTGSGVIAEITFRIVGVGSTSIAFADTKLADNTGSPISHTSEGGYFSNVPPPPPAKTEIFVDPEKIVDPKLEPCKNFTIKVNINEGVNVNLFEFKLGFNPIILEALEVKEGAFLSTVGPTSILKAEINNAGGYVLFSVTLTSPSGASGEGVLANVTFHVKGVGQTPLTLTETTLKDPQGQQLTHTVKSGSFSNILLALESTIDFVPPVINLEIKKNWLACYLELPEGYSVSDIDLNSIRLNETLQIVATAPVEIGDYDGNLIQDLKVHFNKTAVSQMVKAKGIKMGNVTLSVTGLLNDGTPFEGSQLIKVKMTGDVYIDGTVDIYDLANAGIALGATPENPRWKWEADENEDGIIDVFDLVMIMIKFGYTY
ncbi:MAG: cohesin domain-containing protein [Candidatus Bathyarchaeia archaeon]